MTKRARVSSSKNAVSRNIIPWATLLLVGFTGAAACSGSDRRPLGASSTADGGTARAADPVSALTVFRDLGGDRPALKHLAADTASALRLHGDRIIRRGMDAAKGPMLDVDASATYTEAVRVRPIGQDALGIGLRPLVGGASRATLTADGHAIYPDVYGSTDVVLSLGETSLSHTLIFRDRTAPEYMNWELSYAGDKLHPVAVDGGAIVMVDGTGVGRLKISSVKIVSSTGKETQATLSLVGSELGLSVPTATLSYPAAATFSISAPAPGEQFATTATLIKGRVMVILDTSGSMTNPFLGSTTLFADGDSTSVYCDNALGAGFAYNCGASTTCTTANGGRPDWRLTNAVTNPSRMYAAKQALTNVVTAQSGVLDFGLERYAENSLCGNSAYCCTPATGTTTMGRCMSSTASASTLNFYYAPSTPSILTGPGTLPAGQSPLTYAGGCGTATGGGRVLVQPSGTSGAAVLPWVDQVENFCSDGTGKPRNPELRAAGATPLGRSILTANTDWYKPIYDYTKANPGCNPATNSLCDPLIDCRPYVLVVMTDGADSCSAGAEKTPTQQVTDLRAINSTNPVNIYTMGMGDPASGDPTVFNTAELNAMQSAGIGVPGSTAAYAKNQTDIEAAFADIVAKTVKFEVCNGADDNCNTFVDEGLGVYQECTLNTDCGSGTCTGGRCTCTTATQCSTGNTCVSGFCKPACSTGIGACLRNGVRKCSSAGASACCVDDGLGSCTTLTAGTPVTEICNGLDDNCNGIIDDVVGGCPVCIKLPEICNGKDDDCNGVIDDNLTDINLPCGSSTGTCTLGTTACVLVSSQWQIVCQGGTPPTAEICDGKDNNCDTVVDGLSQPCYDGPAGTNNVGTCRSGSQQCIAVLGSGVATWGACVGEVLPSLETCNGLDDNCNSIIDDVPGLNGTCCPSGLCGTGICVAGTNQCSGGALVCVGGTGPATEVCNGIDDNCNGTVDDVAGVGNNCCLSGNCGVGTCAFGKIQCSGSSLACIGSTGPSAEICNGLDDNCNGIVDDLLGKGSSCCPPGIPCGTGICKAGTMQCPVTGTALQCLGYTAPATETCNGLDDDCNGLVDDVPGSGTSCCTSGKCGTGVCAAGVQKCVGSTLTCVGEKLPSTEICDTLDNDCNGTVDDLPNKGNACCRFQDTSGVDLCGKGVCTSGSLQCVSGQPQLQCVGGVGPGLEKCDGIDNNCNNIVDDLPGGTVGGSCCPSGRCGPAPYSDPTQYVGVCRPGVLQCGATGVECVNAINPSVETCDGLDNDCNGVVDDVPGLGSSCCPSGRCGVGICTSGTLKCVATTTTSGTTYSLLCDGAKDKQAEVCDTLDNDCNGLVDDVPGLGAACCPAGSPPGPAPGACNKGVCRPGTMQCDFTTQALACTGGTPPNANLCDGLDNNCDGQIDETAETASDPAIGVSCNAPQPPNDQPPCKPGVTICQAAKPFCSGAITPSQQEICNGQDENCNGIVDDNAPCPPLTRCLFGACRPECRGEFAECPGGTTCTGGYCVPPNAGTGGTGNVADGSVGGTGNAGAGGTAGAAGSGGGGGTAGAATDAGTGAAGSSSGGATGGGAGQPGTGGKPDNSVFGLATGGGGCACRTGGGHGSPLGALALSALLGLGLVSRRRGRRAA